MASILPSPHHHHPWPRTPPPHQRAGLANAVVLKFNTVHWVILNLIKLIIQTCGLLSDIKYHIHMSTFHHLHLKHSSLFLSINAVSSYSITWVLLVLVWQTYTVYAWVDGSESWIYVQLVVRFTSIRICESLSQIAHLWSWNIPMEFSEINSWPNT